MNTTIPKRIIQTSKSLNLTIAEQAAVANIRLLNPDFEYRHFDDHQVEAFVEREFPEYRQVFHSFSVPIQKYDFFRYLAVYRLGGFYFDMDVLLAASLAELVDHACVFPFEALTINEYLRAEHGMDWEVGNYAFGAAAGHPFLLAIIENCVRAQREHDWVATMGRSVPRIFLDEYYVLYTTGPLLVSRTLAEFPEATNHVTVLFPEDVCDAKHWNQFGRFGIHLRQGGWRISKGFVKTRLQRYWELLRVKKMFAGSKKIGKERSLEFRS